jgi:hypothetical protein
MGEIRVRSFCASLKIGMCIDQLQKVISEQSAGFHRMQIFGQEFWVIVYFHVSCTDSTKPQGQTKDEFGTENISTTTIRSSSTSVKLAQEKC